MTPEQYAQLTGATWTFVGTALLAVLGFIANYFLKRARARASEPEMWLQLDKLSVEVYGDGKTPGLKERLSIAESRAHRAEKKAVATAHVIRDLAGQWTGPAPRLNPADLQELDEETLPLEHPWRRRPPSRSRTAPDGPGR